MKNNEKQKEFARMYLTGKFTQRQLAERLEISAVTANKWVKEMQPLQYFTIRKELAKKLGILSKQLYTKENAEIISKLIADIESIERLIIKAKYIPHLTNKQN